MSSDKLYFSREEQLFLMEMLEKSTAKEAVETFAQILTEEKADPSKLKEYLKKIMQKYEDL